MIIWANPNILFCDECAVNSDESRDEISGQNTTEYFNLAHQSCTNATLCNFAHFKCTYIKAAAQLRIKMCHYEVIYEGIFLVRQGTLSVLTLEQNIQCAWCGGSRHVLQGRWGVGPGPCRAMPKSYLYLLHKQRTLLTLGCPCKDKKVLEKH